VGGAQITGSQRAFEVLWPIVASTAILTPIVLVADHTNRVVSSVVTVALIRLVMVVGLFIFSGLSGVMSFGHATFMMFAAYLSAWLTIPPAFKKVILPKLPSILAVVHLSPLEAMGVAIIGTALVALTVGLPLMRLSGTAASIGTFAIFIAAQALYGNWDSMTKGTTSLIGLPVYVNDWVALAFAIGAIATASIYRNSRFGLLLSASREDEVASRASGVRVYRERLLAFVISSTVIGVGGVLDAHHIGALTTIGNTYLNLTFVTLTMLVVGGSRSLTGCIVGVAVVSVLSEVLRDIENGMTLGSLSIQAPAGLGQVGLGLLMLLILIFRPGGIAGDKEIPLPPFLKSNMMQRMR
jgi:branched-chain amino acid transport system permease protein